MADKIEDGGHAFPVCFEGGQNSGEQPYFYEGMSLRDWFAGQALAGIGTWMPGGPFTIPDLNAGDHLKARADWSYRQADAMISVRKGRS